MLCNGPSSSESPAARSIAESHPVRPEGPTPIRGPIPTPIDSKNIFDKARDVGLEPFYLAAFGGGSHSIHGNWHEIYSNHLEWDETTNEFSPQLGWKRPRPQVITSFALVLTETIKIYFQFIGGDELSDYFDPLLDDLHGRVHDLVRAHESHLSAKAWPET